MGAVFRLTDDIEKWLKTIDENPHKAIRIVMTGYTDHKDIITNLEDIKQQIENLKQF